MTFTGSVSPVAFIISGSYQSAPRNTAMKDTSRRMNTFHDFSSAMVDFPVVILSFSHFLMRDWIAVAEETDCANLAFERVYS